MEAYTYRIGNPNPPTLRQKTFMAVALATVCFFLRFGWILAFPNTPEKGYVPLSNTFEIGIWAVSFGALMAFLPRRRSLEYRLVIDEDTITGVAIYSGWMKWLFRPRTIHRGRVRTIFEIRSPYNPAIGISERTRFGARMLGFICVPESLPQFDEIRRLAESWRAPQ